ncbi:TPA: AAA family ATPase [Streptococcus suis]
MNIVEFLSRISFRFNTWDDYGYKQTAELIFNGDSGEISHLIKIYPNTDENFSRIQENRIEAKGKFFLFGQSKDYYQFLSNTLEDGALDRWFTLTGDIVYKGNDFITEYTNLQKEYEESLYDFKPNSDFGNDYSPKDLIGMFDNSFFRDQTLLDWEELLKSLHRLIVNEYYLSDYKFTIKKRNQTVFEVDVKPKDNVSDRLSDRLLPISVSNNVFCIIGGNGSGKTRFIRELSKAIFNKSSEITIENSEFDTQDDANIMKKILYCSFSPFDEKFEIELNPEERERFEYIGLLNYDQEVSGETKIGDRITDDIMKSLQTIKFSKDKSQLWLEAIERISFEEWGCSLIYIFKNDLTISDEFESGDVITSGFDYVNYDETYQKIKNFSSGQKIFLLTITKLILKLTERTVVFIDEPELFLHPPMVKSYVRLISDIVSSVNGLGFIITHSPITLQEFPNRCVKQAYRDYRGEYIIKSVNFNTFGENINVINDQIFNIGLQQSGYYKLIESLKFDKNVEDRESKLRKLLDISGSEARLLINLFLEGTSE